MRLHMVSGGDPDRWLPLLASWRIEGPSLGSAADVGRVPGVVPKRGARTPDHRWSEALVAEVLARVEPTGWHVQPLDDAARGMILCPDDHPGAVHLRADWVYTVTDSPPLAVVRHTISGVQHAVATLGDAWGWLKREAEAAGDESEVERTAAEQTLAALTGP